MKAINQLLILVTGLLFVPLGQAESLAGAQMQCQSYIVKLNVHDVSSKEDVVVALEAISSAYNVRVTKLLSGPTIAFEHQADVLEETDDIRALEALLNTLRSLKGCEVYCDSISHADPRMTGSN